MLSNKKILKNTIFLYGKSTVTVFISLYSTRLLLKSMGTVDYGVFSILAGFIALLSFVNISMSSASQRYISVFLGEGNIVKLNKIFHTSVLFHLIVGIILVLFLEIIGYFFLDSFLNIPIERLESAQITYQLIIIATFFKINAVPYDSLINSHEDMGFLSLVGILETFLALGIAIIISITDYDKLVIYGLLYACLIILLRVIKSIFCILNYKESKLKMKNFKEVFMYKELFSFAKWNLFGALTALGKSQGLNLILNKFIGPIANASFGVSSQLNNQVTFFSRTIEQTLRPQLFKNIGLNDKEKSIYISFLLSKLSFCLTAFFSISFIYYINEILTLWLDEVPKYSALISRFMLLGILSNQLTIGLDNLIHANGDIKKYMIFGGVFKLTILPLSVLFLFFNYDISIVFILYFIIELLNGLIRIIVLKRLGLITFKEFSTYMYRILYPVIASILCLLLLDKLLNFPYDFVVTGITSSIIFFIVFMLVGLQIEEKHYVINKLRNYLK